MSGIRLEPVSARHARSCWEALSEIIRERRHFAFLEPPSLEESENFIREVIERGDTHIVALEGERVVGWCDIRRGRLDVSRHVGILGVGVLPDYRGRGLGRRLMRRALADAFGKGLERVELEVFGANERARRLYKSLGFRAEGVRRRACLIDGRYDDVLLMGLLREEAEDDPIPGA